MTQDPQPRIVVGRHHRQGRRTRRLSGESPVMRGHEPFARGECGEPERSTKDRLHREVCLESSRPDCSLQCPDMDVKFLGKLVERQRVVLSCMMSDDVAGTPQHWCRDGSTAAVPRAESFEWDRQERGERSLSETNGAAQLANLVHGCAHDAIRRGRRQATSGIHGR